MKKNFINWEDKQCANCKFLELNKDGMKCDLFIMPYYEWGKYYLGKCDKWLTREQEKPSPNECWGYCGTNAEFKRRGEI